MYRLMKLLVTGLVTLLALSMTALPAHAATEPAQLAASWVANQSDSLTKAGEMADAALALAAAQDPASAPRAEALLESIAREGAAAVADSPELAAKLVIVAAAFDKDPATFVPGVDLVGNVTSGIGQDGSFGAWPGPFASGLAAVALKRAGQSVPDSLVTHLLTFANDDGGFAFGAGEASDADSTGMALLALVAAGSPEADAAADKAKAWAAANQAEDGSWAGYNPVNSTAVMGAALLTAGVDQSKAIAYVSSQQTDSGALTNNGAEDLLATTQAALLLGSVSYLDVSATPATDASTAPADASVPATTAPAPVPAPADGNAVLPWVLGAIAALALLAGWVLLRRTRSTR